MVFLALYLYHAFRRRAQISTPLSMPTIQKKKKTDCPCFQTKTINDICHRSFLGFWTAFSNPNQIKRDSNQRKLDAFPKKKKSTRHSMHQPLLFQRKYDKAPNLIDKARKQINVSGCLGSFGSLLYPPWMPVSQMARSKMREEETKQGPSLFNKCYFVLVCPPFQRERRLETQIFSIKFRLAL